MTMSVSSQQLAADLRLDSASAGAARLLILFNHAGEQRLSSPVSARTAAANMPIPHPCPSSHSTFFKAH
jgi:hypothetical protein